MSSHSSSPRHQQETTTSGASWQKRLLSSGWFWGAVAVIVASVAAGIIWSPSWGVGVLLFLAIGYATQVWDKFFGTDGHVPELVCPHCNVQGQVWRTTKEQKNGIDGTKAGAAVLTGGTSIFFLGLSQQDKVAALHCKNCGSKWTVRR